MAWNKKHHGQCCGDCNKLHTLPQDEESAKFYSILIQHLPCLKSPGVRKKCQRKADIIAACKWAIEVLEAADQPSNDSDMQSLTT